MEFEKLTNAQVLVEATIFKNNIAFRGTNILVSYENLLENSFVFNFCQFEDDDSTFEAFSRIENEGSAQEAYMIFIESIGKSTLEFSFTSFLKPTFMISREDSRDNSDSFTGTQMIPRFIYMKTKKSTFLSFVTSNFKMSGAEEYLDFKKTFPKVIKALDSQKGSSSKEALTSPFFFASNEESTSSVSFSSCEFQDIVHVYNYDLGETPALFFMNQTLLYIQDCLVRNVLAFSSIFEIEKSSLSLLSSIFQRAISLSVISSKRLRGLDLFQSQFLNLTSFISTLAMIGLDDENASHFRSIVNCSFEGNRGMTGGAIHIQKTSMNLNIYSKRELQTAEDDEGLDSIFKISNSRFLYNSGFEGGAIFSIGSFLMEIINSEFKENVGIVGGAGSFILTQIVNESIWENNKGYLGANDLFGGTQLLLGVFSEELVIPGDGEGPKSIYVKSEENLTSFECSDYGFEKYGNGWVFQKEISSIRDDFKEKTDNMSCIESHKKLVFFEAPQNEFNVAMLKNSIELPYYPGIGFANQSLSFPILLNLLSPDSLHNQKVYQIGSNYFDLIHIKLSQVDMDLLDSTGHIQFNSTGEKLLKKAQLVKMSAMKKENIEEIINNFGFQDGQESMTWVLNMTFKSSQNQESAIFPFHLTKSVCPDSYTFFKDAGKCVKCWIDMFSLEKLTSDQCFSCREGGLCINGYMITQEKYWRTGPESDLILECMNDACLGESYLVEGLNETEFYRHLPSFDFGTPSWLILVLLLHYV